MARTFNDINLGRSVNDGRSVNLSHARRRRHTMLIGGSDSGKSRLFQHKIRQDLHDRLKPGLMLLDPHGSLYEDIVSYCAWRRIDRRRRIHIIDPKQQEWAVGFNPLDVRNGAAPDVVAATMRDAFCQVWGEDMADKPGVRDALDVVLYTLTVNNLSLFDTPDVTRLRNLDRLSHYAETVSDPTWSDRVNYFLELGLSKDRNAHREFDMFMSAVGRRVADFTGNEYVRNIISQTGETLDLLECMQQGDVILVNLQITPQFDLEKQRLLGTLLINSLYLQAFGRTEEEGMAHPFYLYVDECHRFLTDKVTKILFELRKFGVHALLSLQSLSQLEEAGVGIYKGVLDGTQTKIAFGGLSSSKSEMAELIFGNNLDYEEAVDATRAMSVVGYKKEWLHSEMEMEADGFALASGGGSAGGVTAASGSSEMQDLDGNIITLGVSDVDTTSSVDNSFTSEVSSTVHSKGLGKHEALVPILEERPTQVYNVDTQLHKKAAYLDDLSRQLAVVKTRSEPPVTIRVADVHDVPNKTRSKLPQEFKQRVFEQSKYARLTRDVHAELIRTQKTLVQQTTVPAPTDDDFAGYD